MLLFRFAVVVAGTVSMALGAALLRTAIRNDADLKLKLADKFKKNLAGV